MTITILIIIYHFVLLFVLVLYHCSLETTVDLKNIDQKCRNVSEKIKDDFFFEIKVSVFHPSKKYY